MLTLQLYPSNQLAKRADAREKATEELKAAEEKENQEDIDKYQRRLVKMTKEHMAECQRLLHALGVPVVQAPMEAEAQCAQLAKEGKVWAVATEDMDALTFAAPILLRKLSKGDTKKEPILEFNHAIALEDLGLNHNEFIDLCILFGCDYIDTIRGIGPKTAFDLIKKHRSIEKIVAAIDTTKHPIPENFDYVRARELFTNHETLKGDEVVLKWDAPKDEEVKKFLVEEKGFNEERINSSLKRLKDAKAKGTQLRMDSFFTAAPSSGAPKRKPEPLAAKGAKKSKK